MISFVMVYSQNGFFVVFAKTFFFVFEFKPFYKCFKIIINQSINRKDDGFR